jgi:hypothetical protein
MHLYYSLLSALLFTLYFKGRFSNGPVWVEELAKQMGAKLTDFATGGGTSHSFRPYSPSTNSRRSNCSATSDDTLVQGFTGPKSDIAVPSAIDQLTAYLSANPSDIRGNLFVILIGANDVLFDSNVTATKTVKNVEGIIEKLRTKGTHPFFFFFFDV